MGYEAECTMRFDGRTARGTARLEHKDLVFRPEARGTAARGVSPLRVPLGHITQATARDGTLVVRFGGRRAELDVGDAAARWAERITNPPSRLAKLGVKGGLRVALVNLAEDAFRREIEAAGAEVIARPAANTDAIFFGAERPSDLERLRSLAAFLQPAGALWVVRRKGETAVSERESMAAGKRAGLVDVKVVSFSDTHTAEKYVIPKTSRPVISSAATPSTGRRSSASAPRTRGSASSRGRT